MAVGNEGSAGRDGENGIYKSGAVYFPKNTKIYLNAFSGTSFAGCDYFARLSITHIDYKDDAVMKYDLFQAGKSEEVYTGEADSLRDAEVVLKEDGRDFCGGFWSIYKSSAFYTDIKNQGEYSYRDISEFVRLERRLSDSPGAGIVYSSNLQAAELDRNWMSVLKIRPKSRDGIVNFMIAGCKYLNNNDGISVIFTIPEDGTYTLDFDIENMGISGVFGSGNMVRISILKDGETKESKKNSRDFEIRNADGSRGRSCYPIGREELSKNDKIVISVYGGLDWYGDNFFAKCIVNKVDNCGDTICSYSLSNMDYADTGSWNFYTGSRDIENSDDFEKLFAHSGGSGKVSVTSVGGVCKNPDERSDNEEKIRFGKSSAPEILLDKNEDVIVAYKPDGEGAYQFFADIISAPEGVSAGIYKNNKLISEADAVSGKTLRTVLELKSDDMLYIRFSNRNEESVSLTVDFKAYNKNADPEKEQRDFINVKDFGALGDGKNDDLEALREAFDAAADMGKNVYIPAGTYLHSDILKVDGFHIFGDGAERTALVSTNDRLACVELRGVGAGIFEIGLFGAEGERTSSHTAAAVYANHAEKFVISGCRIRLFSGAGIIVRYSSFGSIFNNYIENTRADGIHVVALSNNVEVMYNTVYSSGDDSISFTSYKKDGGMTFGNSAYKNYVLALPGSRGIVACGGENNKIFSNYIDSGVQGIAAAENSSWDSYENKRIYIYDNTVKNTFVNSYPESGGAISLYNDNGIKCSEIEIFNNDLYNPCFYGLRIAGDCDIEAEFDGNVCYFDSDVCRLLSNVNTGGVNIKNINNEEKRIEDYLGDKNPAGVETFIKTPYSKIDTGYRFISDQTADKDWNPWSFFVTSGYASGEKFSSASGWEYGDTSDENYFVPVKARYYYEAGALSRVRNVFVSPSERFGNQSTMIRI